MTLLSGALQVVGLAAIALGLGLIYLPAGIVGAGAAALATGILLGLPPRSRT